MRDWLRARFVHIAIGAMAIVCIGGAVLIYMLSGLDEVPGWWRERESIQPGDAGVIALAERIENGITTQLTAVRDPDQPRWSAKINDAQANAWLTVRLRETIETHMGRGVWGDGIERVYVQVRDDELRIGARVRHATGSAIVSSRVTLGLDDEGDLWAHMHGLRVGRTPVPAWALRLLGSGDARTGRVRLGPGALGLGDGREARLVALRVRDSWLEVVVETRARSR